MCTKNTIRIFILQINNFISLLFSINLTTVPCNKSLYVEFSFTSLVVHKSDFSKDFTFFPAHVMYSTN